MLHARFNGPPLVEGPVLLIVCSYRGGIKRAAPFSIAERVPSLGIGGRAVDRLTLLPLRRFIAGNRDFFANPRDLTYQMGLARDLLTFGAPNEVVCAVDAAWGDLLDASEFSELGHVEMRPHDELARDADRYATVGLIYPDALGLGWSRLEARLRALRKQNVVFVNGRRRTMTLDSAARRALGWRRFLARSRLPELAFAGFVLPVAAACAAVDALRGLR